MRQMPEPILAAFERVMNDPVKTEAFFTALLTQARRPQPARIAKERREAEERRQRMYRARGIKID